MNYKKFVQYFSFNVDVCNKQKRGTFCVKNHYNSECFKYIQQKLSFFCVKPNKSCFKYFFVIINQ